MWKKICVVVLFVCLFFFGSEQVCVVYHPRFQKNLAIHSVIMKKKKKIKIKGNYSHHFYHFQCVREEWTSGIKGSNLFFHEKKKLKTDVMF